MKYFHFIILTFSLASQLFAAEPVADSANIEWVPYITGEVIIPKTCPKIKDIYTLIKVRAIETSPLNPKGARKMGGSFEQPPGFIINNRQRWMNYMVQAVMKASEEVIAQQWVQEDDHKPNITLVVDCSVLSEYRKSLW